MNGDTIAAIATAPGKAGIAVVRVSGPDAFAIAETLTGKPVAPGRISYRKLYQPPFIIQHSSFTNHPIDDAIVLSFANPNSYTGEDVVEFQCHGGSVTPRRILEACFASGARLARRGEFTERAFLNGKLDLSGAESVIDLIEAKTDAAADDALAHLGGAEKCRYRELYDQALAISSELEHSLDVDESDLTEEFLQRLNSSLSTLHSSLREAVESAKRTLRFRDGALVVLAGPPNAGKSSLLNALLGENRAIVSDVPGTTRDSIEAWIDLGGIPVRLVDTAGLRGTSDAIESEGVRRAEELIAQADLVLMLSETGEFAPAAFPSKTIFVRTKIDLQSSNLPTLQSSNLPALQPSISAKTGEGMEWLRHLLIDKLSDLEPRQSSRSIDLLTSACSHLDSIGVSSDTSSGNSPSTTSHSSFFIRHSSFSPDPVLAANAVRSAAESLGQIVGAVYSDDLLDSVFSRFCVGK